MKTILDIDNETLVVRINGELDHHLAAQLRQQIDQTVMQGGIRKIIFDFSGVGLMDSSGIGLIMGRYKLMQAVDGEVCAFGISPQLDKLITMSGIKRIIKIYQTEEQAKSKGGEK